MDINKKIQQYIELKGLKLIDIAKKINVSKQNFSRMLNSDDLKISQLIDICKVLEVAPTYFFDGTETINNEEVEGYKKRINELEQLLNLNSRHKVEQYISLVKSILKYEFVNEEEEIKNEIINNLSELIELVDTFIIEGNEVISTLAFEISDVSQYQIKKRLEEQINNIKVMRRAKSINKLKTKNKP